jgi:hypothetical protein
VFVFKNFSKHKHSSPKIDKKINEKKRLGKAQTIKKVGAIPIRQ